MKDDSHNGAVAIITGGSSGIGFGIASALASKGAYVYLLARNMDKLEKAKSEINISVPKSQTAKEVMRSPGEIIINVTQEGKFIVNQKLLESKELESMLNKVSSLFPDQPVIIRADEKTMHKHVVKVLDACAQANIWDISFAATIMTQ